MSMIKRTVFQYQIGAKGSSLTKPIINQADVLTNIIDLVVKDNGQPFDLELLGLSVDFHFLNSSGEYLTVPATEIVGDTASVIIPQSIIEYGGNIEFEIEIHDTEKSVNATGFSFTIERTKRKTSGAFPTNQSGNVEVNWVDVLGKPDYYSPSIHSHMISDLTDFPNQNTNSGKVLATDGTTLYWSDITATSVSWSDITNKPTSFTPTAHTHSISDVSNLESALDSKSDSSHTHLIGDINNLQSILDSKSDSNHTHTAQELGLTTSIINVKNYGAVGDGVTDDSQAIRDAIADVPLDGGYLLFPSGVYLHGDGIVDPVNGTGNDYPEDPSNPTRPLMSSDVNLGRDIRFLFNGYKNLTVSGYGATIISNPNNGECMHNSMFEFNNCENLLVEGFVLNGNKIARVPTLNDYENGQGWNNRNNISVFGGNNVTLKDITSIESMMDGFGIGGAEEDQITNLNLINCISDNAYRNGLTLSTCRDVLITSSKFIKTGQTYGIAPKIGVDIEADWGGTFNENITIEKTYFTENVIAGLAFAVGARNCHLNECVFDGEYQSPAFALDDTRWGYNYIRNCHFINTGLATNTQGVYVENNTFELFPQAGSGESAQMDFFHFQGDDPIEEAQTFIRNNTFRVDLSGISETATSVDVGRMWFGSRKNIIFSDNTIINLYSGGSAGVYVINWSNWSTKPEAQIINNKFIFTEPRLIPLMNENLIASEYDSDLRTNYFRDNIVLGYPSYAIPTLQRTDTRSYVTGQNYVKSELLWNNTLYKLNPKTMFSVDTVLQSNMKLTFFKDNKRVEVEYIGGWFEEWKVVCYVNGVESIDIPSEVAFYQDGDNLYMKVLTSRATAKVEINVSGANSYGRLYDGVNIFNALDDDTEITGFTALKYNFEGKSIASKSDTVNHNITVGHNVFITGANKSAWWNGTAWVDANGTLIP